MVKVAPTLATLDDFRVRFQARMEDERARAPDQTAPTLALRVLAGWFRGRGWFRRRALSSAQDILHRVDRRRRAELDRLLARLRVVGSRPHVRLWRVRALLLLTGASAKRLAEAGSAEAGVGNIDRALARWSRALVLDPTLFGVYEEYAYELWQRGRWDDAADLYAQREEVRKALASERMLDWLPFEVLDRQFAAAVGVTAMLDVYVKQQILAGLPTSTSILLTHQYSIANRSYVDYWDRYVPLHVIDNVAYDALERVIEIVRVGLHALPHPDGGSKTYSELGAEVQSQWESEGREALLRLSDAHVERGRACLERLGVPRDSWFVTLHIREDGYHPVRNADISSYRRAISAITDRGGWVVRMGGAIHPEPGREMSRLQSLPQVVDYTHSDARSDWMDVFLWGGCRFLLGTLSGPAHVAATFGVPAVYSNSVIGYRSWYGADLALPKLYWSTREKRYLTFAEALSSPVGFTHMLEPLRDRGIELVDNTAEQLEAVTVEMIDRLDGTAGYTADDLELQRRYDSFEPPLRHRRPPAGARIGRDFLREYRDLLPS